MSNFDLMTRHPDSKNARGGTELMQERLYSTVERSLLEPFQIWFSRYNEAQKDPSKIQLLYVHDLPGDPMYATVFANQGWKNFAKILFVSNWQMQKFMDFYDIPWSHCLVMKNAIEPFNQTPDKLVKDKVGLIYHTTPHRGLNILAAVWPLIKKKWPVTLDVYSSFGVYGWNDRDNAYKDVFDGLAKDGATLHGAVPNGEVREALLKSHIFAYPSIWPETSCLALMEAMGSRNVCVHSNLAALPETSAGFTVCYQMDEDINRHAGIFYDYLDNAIAGVITQNESINNLTSFTQQYVNYTYNWEIRAEEWNQLLSELLRQNTQGGTIKA